MLRMSVRKVFASTVVLSLVALSAAACSPGAEKAPTNTAATNSAGASNSSNASNSPGAGQTNATRAKVNLNTASREELLAAVPNLGDRMAHEFEEYRPYKSIQQFRKEISKYVAPVKVKEYEQYVFVPISENDSDAETLQQIPGLDAGEAAALVAGRPYASRDAFISKLSEQVSPADLAVARTYLVGR